MLLIHKVHKYGILSTSNQNQNIYLLNFFASQTTTQDALGQSCYKY